MWDANRFRNRLESTDTSPLRLPPWLRRPMPQKKGLPQTQSILNTQQLPTVCEEARCPNLAECWSRKTATFLALGSQCTRSCGFCEIGFHHTPPPPDEEEPKKIAHSVQELGLQHVVITMVARDDLADGGAGHIVAILHEIRKSNHRVTTEVLTSDFAGSKEALDAVLQEKPNIFNHNIETVERLSPRVRHKAHYQRTLGLLKHAAQQKSRLNLWVKSGIMVGLGEEEEEVLQTMQDLHHAGCDILTIGQYLQPSKKKLRVKAFVPPEQFTRYAEWGHQMGIAHMYCGPFVRSSYNAEAVLHAVKEKIK